MRKISLLICISILLIGCEKEKIIEVEVEKEYSWKAHKRFTHENVTQMNSFATDDYLFFRGLSTFVSIVPEGKNHHHGFVGGKSMMYYLIDPQSHQIKLPIGPDYLISYTHIDGEVRFYSTMLPNGAQESASLNIKDIDNTFLNFKHQQLHFTVSESCVINDRNQALIPYTINNNSWYLLKLALVDVSVRDMPSNYVEIVKTKTISIPEEWQQSVHAIESVGEYFFITTQSKVFRVDSKGNIVTVSDTPLLRIIESSGKLYGVGNKSVFISSDKGLTWKEIYNVQQEFSWISLSKVEDKIVGYRYSQLWEITFNENDLIVRELDNYGIDGVSITSLSVFDNNVYLSTMSGVFYKPVDDFFESKIIEEE